MSCAAVRLGRRGSLHAGKSGCLDSPLLSYLKAAETRIARRVRSGLDDLHVVSAPGSPASTVRRCRRLRWEGCAVAWRRDHSIRLSLRRSLRIQVGDLYSGAPQKRLSIWAHSVAETARGFECLSEHLQRIWIS